MLSLFKKLTNPVHAERCILEEFIQHHELHLAQGENEVHIVPHIRNEKSNPITTVVYQVTKKEVEILKDKLWHICHPVMHEDELWYMGNIPYAGRKVGFYLGMSYELEHEWARFWLE